jgi:membrane protease YdiL (CAAX protease family)
LLLSKTDLHFVIGGALLLGGAVFHFPFQNVAMVLVMLFYPYSDKNWNYPPIKPQSRNYIWYFFLLLMLGSLLLSDALTARYVSGTLLLAAIPEEWFFRVYFQMRLHAYLKQKQKVYGMYAVPLSIVISSLVFAAIHAIMQNNLALLPLIFIPSVALGYIYYLTLDFIIVVLTHAVFNMIYLVIMVTFPSFFNLYQNLFFST